MTRHTKEKILEQLGKASVRFKWGGVLALDRSVLNRALEQQFNERLGAFGFIGPVSLQADLEEGGQQAVSFNGLTFGMPQVSFEDAAFTGPELTLRVPIIAGNHVQQVTPVAKPTRVLQSFSIREDMGYWVAGKLPLQLASNASGTSATLILDLAQMNEWSCNLTTFDYANNMIGQRLKATLGDMAVYRRSYTLGRFDLQEYYPLSPDRLELRTMAAPWGTQEGPRQGDGAALVFMQLGTDDTQGESPNPHFDFPYPIPEHASGLPGTLILDPTLRDLGAGDALEALKSLHILDGYRFVDSERRMPLDWVLFGAWQPGKGAVSIAPAQSSVIAGQRRPFTLQGVSDAVRWSARNLARPLATGAFEGAEYCSRDVADFAQDQQLVVVSATYPEGETEGRRHALLIEHARPVQVAPHVASWSEGNSPIELRAASSDGGTLHWSLVDTLQLPDGPQRQSSPARAPGIGPQSLGILQDLGDGRARFTPHAPSDAVPEILIQRIRVTDEQSGASAECAVIIVAWSASLAVEPYHVPQLQSSQTIPFTLGDSNRKVTWHVFGEGDIDGDGNYTPPANPVLPAAVIMADDGDDGSGYAIVEFAQGRVASSATKSWASLSTFEIKVVGSPVCFANGWQQLEVEVSVAASDGSNNQPLEISDADLATLRLLVHGSSNEIPFLAPGEDAIDPKSGLTWAVSNDRNVIPPPGQRVAEHKGVEPLGQIRTRSFFIHTRQAATLEVFAAIQNSESFVWFYSQGEKGKVTLTGTTVPQFAIASYSFSRERVSREVSPIEGDEFVYLDKSNDYWRLEHVLREGKIVKFVQLKIAGNNRSLVRWASEQYEDHYCSYTGFAFHPGIQDAVADERMLYDGTVYRLAKARAHTLPDFQNGRAPAPGELMLSLNRLSHFKFWDDEGTARPYRAKLGKPLLLELIDQEGNQHKLLVDFGISSADAANGLTARDKLQLSLR